MAGFVEQDSHYVTKLIIPLFVEIDMSVLVWLLWLVVIRFVQCISTRIFNNQGRVLDAGCSPPPFYFIGVERLLVLSTAWYLRLIHWKLLFISTMHKASAVEQSIVRATMLYF